MAKMRCASRVLNFGYRGRIELFLPQATLSSPPPSPETPPPNSSSLFLSYGERPPQRAVGGTVAGGREGMDHQVVLCS